MTHGSLVRAGRGAAAGTVVAALVLAACSAPGDGAREAITPAQMTLYRAGVTDAAAVEARYRALPPRPAGRVQATARPGSLVHLGTREAGSGPDRAVVSVSTTTDESAFDRLCAGGTDVAETVRPMAEHERDACAAAGLEVVELPVAVEATTVVVDGDSPLEGCLSTTTLAGILADPPTITSWAQLGLGEAALVARTAGTAGTAGTDVEARLSWLLGSTRQRRDAAALTARTRERDDQRRRLAALRAASESADAALRDSLLARDEDRGGDRAVARAREAAAAALARRAVVRRAYDGVAARLAAATAAARAERARAGRVVVLPFADYQRHRRRLSALQVAAAPVGATGSAGSAGSAGCVPPEPGPIAAGDYPLARPVVLTTTLRSWDRPEVAAYLTDLLGAVPRLARASGRVAAPADDLAALVARVAAGDPPLRPDPTAPQVPAASPPPPAP